MMGMLLVPAYAAAEVVERILAVVNDELVLLTDLERNRAFCPGPASITPLVAAVAADGAYPGLQALINKRLVVSEARRLNISVPADVMVEERRQALIDRLGGVRPLTSMMAAHGVDQDDLLAMLREHLLIRRFLEVRIFPFIRMAPSRGNSPVAMSQSTVDTMRKARASQRLERYLSRLREKATIEINPPL